jgi:hypothetical protein
MATKKRNSKKSPKVRTLKARSAKPRAAKARAKPAAKKPKRVAKRVAKKAKPVAAKRNVAAKKKKAPPAARPAARHARAKPIRRRDATGHLNPSYAAGLRALSEHESETSSFVERPRSSDDLVEELGEEFVSQATSAEHKGEELLDQVVPEERGGPFVETSGAQEFADGTDESNPKDATREPFPKT